MKKRCWLFPLSIVLIFGLATTGRALIIPSSRGMWPEDWPQELETLRPTSRTIQVATGIQENIYEIPIPDRETFERIWPTILKLRTPGSPLTLYRANSAPPHKWNMLSNKVAAVRIYGPSNSYVGSGTTKEQLEENILEGRASRARAPWPKDIVGAHGELPKYVVDEKDKDGHLRWIPADQSKDAKPRGFYHRARIDVELVIDGKVIDLNHVELPEGATIVDRRFQRE